MRLTVSKLRALAPLPILLAGAFGSATGQASSVVTASELATHQGGSTYQAILHIRPELFRSRDEGSLMLFNARSPAVAVDNTLVGGIEVLRTIPVDQVVRLQYISAEKAAKSSSAIPNAEVSSWVADIRW